MLKRLLVALTGLVGVVVIGLGVASATLWRADDVLVAELRADEPLVVTDPGVLELADVKVTVRAVADGPVVLAVGRDTDVVGWLGEDPHQRVTGLAGWHELAAEAVEAPAPTPTATDDAGTDTADGEGEAPPEGDAAPEDGAAEGDTDAAPQGEGDAGADGEGSDDAPAVAVPDPSGSDLWVVEARGDGEAELTWTAQPGRWSLLAASTDGSPLRVSLAWPQVVTTPWLWPCVVVGSLLLLTALALVVRDLRRRRRPAEAAWTPVATGPLPTVAEGGAPTQLTRRQLRELAARGAVAGPGAAPAREHEQAPSSVGAGEPEAAGPALEGRGAAAAGSARRVLGGVGRRRGAGEPTDEATATAGSPPPAPSSAPAGPPAASPVGSPAPGAPAGAPTAGARPWDPRPAGPEGTSAPVPAGGSPGGAPRWSVGDGRSPWSTGPAEPSRPGPTPSAPASAAAPGDRAPVGRPAAPAGGTAGGATVDPRWPGGTGSASGRPGSSGPERAGSPGQPAGVAQAAGAGHPAGRPAWLGRPAGSPLPPPGAPGSPDAGSARAEVPRPTAQGPGARPDSPSPTAPWHSGTEGRRPGWTPAPPAPGAVVGRTGGPDATSRRGGEPGPAAPAHGRRTAEPHDPARPAWLRDAPTPSGPRSEEQGAAGASSRADAWRRAWGLSAEQESTTQEQEEDR